MKVHDSFAVMKLTPELMDEYIEGIEVHPDEKKDNLEVNIVVEKGLLLRW